MHTSKRAEAVRRKYNTLSTDFKDTIKRRLSITSPPAAPAERMRELSYTRAYRTTFALSTTPVHAWDAKTNPCFEPDRRQLLQNV